jgi:TOMM system kinase/cyclase fusion protein
MTFDEVLDQVRALLHQRGRVTYRSLKLRYQLDDEVLAGVTDELISAERVAVDEDGKVLVWTGGATVASSQLSVVSPQPPTSSSQSSDPKRQTPDARPTDGERRQLTVMFIDLVGSTTLSQQLDPEDYHARVVAYQTACRQVIARYEGHIAQYLGDGVLVYFGYPTAHEEDAVRAVRSGLEIVTAVSQLEFTPPLQVRIGIHTGPVVVGEIGAGERTERLALGETPNIAARVQGQADPNSVVISQATYRLVQGLFRCEAMGPQELKNVTAPLELYRIQGEGEAHTRFEVSVQKGLTPLVGRAEELALLQQRWAQAKSGAGQVVLVSGEPGIGKSRLVQELREHVNTDGATRIEFRCSPYHQNSAFYPIIEHLQRLLQFTREDSPATKLEKLQHTLSHYRFPQADTLPLLAALLSLPHPEGYPPITMSPQKQKEKTQAALVAWLMEEAERQSVYNPWEDIHWADPSTLEVLTLVIDQAPTTRLYVLLTFRPEFLPSWGNRSYLSQLTLSRLGREHVEAMVERVTGGKPLPAEVVQQIVAKTDGVPLYVEELTKTVVESVESLESGSTLGQLSLQLGIPATLHDALMARLDRLGPAKDLAQLGATLGREFSYELLQAVSLLDEATLQHGLKQLVEVELVYQRGLVPQAHYLFKHALIQDTAYQSLLKSKRQQLHQQIAQVLAERFAETVETQPELVAHHYTEAGLVAQAIPYWQQAGQRASQRSANIEAISHLTKGLELLKTLPDTPARAQQELMLQVALSIPLMLTRGWAAPEVGRVHSRAQELCRQIGETPQLFPILHGVWTFHFIRAELRTAQELGEQMLTLAQSTQDSTLLLEAHRTLGESLYVRGELVPAQHHFEQGIVLYDPQQHRSLAFLYGHDPGVSFLSFAAFALWCLGYPDQALARSHEALALAQGLSHPFSLAYALNAASWLHQLRREGRAAQERAEAMIVLSSEHEFPLFLATGTILRGWALAEQGQGEGEIAQMRQSLVGARVTGAEVFRPYFRALLAEAYRKAGQVEEGLNALAEALDTVHKTGERWYEAELYRLYGELSLRTGESETGRTGDKKIFPDSPIPRFPVSSPEACFLKAIDIARQQSAKSWELRASTSLARLWQSQGKKAEAHKLLSDVYNWFTEGFDTKDLQEAKALIEELSH